MKNRKDLKELGGDLKSIFNNLVELEKIETDQIKGVTNLPTKNQTLTYLH